MADIDLATILAEGEYLKRSGGELVGDIPAGGGGGGSDLGYVVVAGGTGFNDRFKTAITDLVAAGGGTIMLDGAGTLTEAVTIPDEVGVVGHGKQSDDVIDLTAAGQLRIGTDNAPTRHPTTGGFLIRTTTAPVPLYVGWVINCYFTELRVQGGTQTGMLIEYAQNTKFESWESVPQTSARYQYAVTIGTGINNCTFDNLNSRGATIAPLRIVKTTASSQSGTILPRRLRFMGGLNEEGEPGSTAAVLIEAGQDLSWYDAQSAAPTGTPNFLLTTEGGADHTILGVRIMDCQLYTTAGSTTSLVQVKGTATNPIADVVVEGCRWLNGKGFGLNQYASLRDRGAHFYDANDGQFTSLDGTATEALILTDATRAATVAEVTAGTSARVAVTPRDIAAIAAVTPPRTIIGKGGAAATGALGDAGCYLRFTLTNPTYTIPPHGTVAFPIGTQIDGSCNASAMTIIAGVGVTINKARTLVTVGAGSGWTMIKANTNVWDLHGDFV